MVTKAEGREEGRGREGRQGGKEGGEGGEREGGKNQAEGSRGSPEMGSLQLKEQGADLEGHHMA